MVKVFTLLFLFATFFATAQNIGVGTVSPGSKLEIMGLSGDESSDGVLRLTNSSGITHLRLGTLEGNRSWIQSHGSLPLFLNRLGNNLILNETAGNVGIGTANPQSKLDVEGSAFLGYESNVSDFGGLLKSGFYQDGGAAIAGDVPDQSHGWTHLITSRHSNTGNNHQLQIASSYNMNDRLFFRKIAAGNQSLNPDWHELATRGSNTFTGDQAINGNITGTASNQFIQNQYAGAQSANSWISGEARAGGNILAGNHFVNESGDPYFRTNTDNKHIVLSGGSGWAATGATMVLRGASAGYNPHGIEFYSGGAERMRILSNGNVGIGTVEPIGKLHVAGNHAGGVMADGNDRPSISSTGAYPQMVMMSGHTGNSNHGPTLMLGGYDNGASGSHKHWSIGTAGANSSFLDIGYHAGTDLNPHAGIRNYNGSTFMTILNSGNVGIGTIDPVSRLHVAGGVRIGNGFNVNVPNSCGGNWVSNANFAIWTTDYTGGCGDESYIAQYIRSGEATTLEIGNKNDADDHIALMPSGNAGVGVNNPEWRLHVEGVGTPAMLTRQNGNHSHGIALGLETYDNGSQTQDGPRIGFHKRGAKIWATGIEPSGNNGYAIWEDGYNGQWGSTRFIMRPGMNPAAFYKQRNSGNYVQADMLLERTGVVEYFPSISFHNPGYTAPQWFGAYSPERLNAGNCCTSGGWIPVGASAFQVLSDISVKKNIQDLSDIDFTTSLNQIRNIRSIRYNYNNETSGEIEPYSGFIKRDKPHIGFSAQSLPDEVVTDDMTRSPDSNKDGYVKGYSLADMDGLLVAGIKSLDNTQQKHEEAIKKLEETVKEQQKVIYELIKILQVQSEQLRK